MRKKGRPPKPEKVDQITGLSQKQALAVEMLGAGKSVKETSQTLGIHRATLWHWKTESDAFKCALNAVEEEVKGSIKSRLLHLHEEAIEALERSLRSGHEGTTLRAAQFILKQTLQFAPLGKTDVREILRNECRKFDDIEMIINPLDIATYVSICEDLGIQPFPDYDKLKPEPSELALEVKKIPA